MPGTVNVVDRTTGQTFGVPAEQVAAYTAQGFRPESDEESIDRTAAETFHAEHGGAAGAVGSALAGGLSGLTLGLSDQALGALGADRTLRHMEAEHPYATGAGTFVGALAPTVLTGGAAAGEEAAGIGARILAHSPAGLVGGGGRAISELGEGAGLVGRLAAGTAGAAAEGAAYGGGQYLTESALEDKPLSAAGFVAGMGHGALFAAPIGAAGTLASATLQRARSLFPRSEVSAAAASGVKGEATSALGQAVRDGDAMAQAAERKLSDVDAGAQMAQAGETATRRVFGQAHPQAFADQVTGAVDRQQVAQALQGYQQARQGLEDWIAGEADPELEHALLGIRGGDLQTPALAAQRVPVGEFGAPGARGIKTPDELQRIAEGSAGDGAAPALEQVTGAGGPRALRGGAIGTPAEPAAVPAQEIVQRGMGEQPATAAGKRPAGAMETPAGFDIHGSTEAGPVFDKNPTMRSGVPGFSDLERETYRKNAYVVRPSELEGPKLRGITSGEDMVADARTAKVREAWGRGESTPALEIDVDPKGHYFVADDGNHRLLAAAADGDRPVLARFRPVEAEVGNMDRIGDDLRRALGRGEESTSSIETAHPGIAKEYSPDTGTRLNSEGALGFNGDAPLVEWAHKSGFAPEGAGPVHTTPTGFSYKPTITDPDSALSKYIQHPSEFNIDARAGRLTDDIKRLDAEIGARRMPETITTFRGVRSGPLTAASEGEVVNEAGFMSSSPTERRAKNFATGAAKPGETTPTIVEFDIPKGTQAHWVSDFEGEILLGRGHKLEIVSVGFKEIRGKNVRMVRARLREPSSTIPATDTLTGQLRGTMAKLSAGESLAEMGRVPAAAARAEQADRAATAAEHFRNKALAGRPLEGPLEREVGDVTMGRILAKHGLGEPAAAPVAAREPDALGARILRNESRPVAIAPTAPVSDAAVAGEGKLAPPMSKAEIADQRGRFRAIAPEQRAAKAIMWHNGKGTDMGPGLARAAKAIGAVEEANAKLVDILGPEAPPQAAAQAKAYRATVAEVNDRAAASTARTAQDLATKARPAADATVVDDDVTKALRQHDMRAAAKAGGGAADAGRASASAGSGVGGRLADVGSALEVLRAIGAHVPVLSHIPVIGPILGLWLKARAVIGILGRKGGSIGKSTEGLIAAKSAATRDRIVAATGVLLEGGARATGKVAHLAGPAVLLADALFPGGEKPASDKPRDLFEARTNDIVRAQQPGAIDQAIAQRFPTSDPAMHDAIVAQVQRGIAFLDSKRPKETVLPGILPGDGTWKPSAASIDEFGKFVHAVNDPVSVLEDLAKGHPSAEGAETLRVVYPELYQLAQKELLQAAPAMAKTLPYSRRVMLSILYQIPVDGTMQPSHAQYLQAPAPATAAPRAPASTGPLRLGQQTMSPLDQRASGA